MPRPRPVYGRLLLGLDLLVAGLTMLVVVVPAHASNRVSWPLLGLGLVFLLTYWWGRQRLLRPTANPFDPVGVTPTTVSWLLILAGCWLGLLPLSDQALWLGFPLMLLGLQVWPPRWGLIWVFAITAVTVAVSIADGLGGWASVGGILGPLVGAGLAIGSVFGLRALARESAERARIITELHAARESLAAAARQQAVAAERERLAREIHDTLAQGFVSTDLLLRLAGERVADERASELIGQAREVAQANLQEARRFVRELAPPALAANSLTTAVETELRRLPDTLQGDLRVDGPPRRLPAQVEATALRIIQSALANVQQHAQADRVVITLTYTDDEFLVDVIDDGDGFDPSAPVHSESGFGLPTMAARVAELGGRFDVESSPGKGCAIAVALPNRLTDPTLPAPAPAHPAAATPTTSKESDD